MQNASRLLVHRLPRAEQRDRRQEAGQHDQQQADAVDADVVVDAERRNPRRAARRTGTRPSVGVEAGPQQQRHGEREQRHDQRDPAGSARRCARRRCRRTAAARRRRAAGATSEVRSGNGITAISTGSSRGSARRRGTATPRRCAPSRSAAGAARRSLPPTDRADAVDRAVDDAGVDALPQPFLATRCWIGCTIVGVVDLVDVVLVQQQPVHAGEARAPARSAACRSLQEEERRDADAANGDADETRHQRRARATSLGSTPWLVGDASAAAPARERRRREARLEKRLEAIRAAERVRHADVAGERPSRPPARSARAPSPAARRAGARRARRAPCASCAVRRVRRARRRARPRPAPLAVERQEHQPEHVDRGQQRRQQRRPPTARCGRSAKVANRISSLLKKPASRGHAGDRQRADQERPVGDRQLLLQAAHVAACPARRAARESPRPIRGTAAP